MKVIVLEFFDDSQLEKVKVSPYMSHELYFEHISLEIMNQANHYKSIIML